VKLGAKEVPSPREAAIGADVVLSSLPMPAGVEAVVLGSEGILLCVPQKSPFDHAASFSRPYS
jgi:3-hydroxyisobutyrate dehydrogenase-like beta-hydroxyacid dehydrogenase